MTVDSTPEFYSGLGKTPVRIHKEAPGFVANLLQSAVLHEAIHLVPDGVVDAPELDTVMTTSLDGLGRPSGRSRAPISAADRAGYAT